MWDELAFPRLENQQLQRHDGGIVIPSRAERKAREASVYMTQRIPQAILNTTSRLVNGEIFVDTAVFETPESLEQEQLKSLLERFCLGVVAHLDDQVQSQVLSTSFRWQAANFAAHPGKIIARPWVKKSNNDSKLAEIDCPIYDPYHCYHDFHKPPFRFIYEVWMETDDALAELERLEKPIPRKLNVRREDRPAHVSFADYWIEEPGNKVWNATLIDEELAGDIELQPFSHLPHVIVAINTPSRTRLHIPAEGSPQEARGTSSNFIDSHAQPRFHTIEHTVALYNEVKSLEVRQMKLAVGAPFLFKSEDGQWTIQDHDWQPFTRISTDHDKIIQQVQVANQSLERNSVTASLEVDLDGYHPLNLLGQPLGGDPSGFLYLQVTDTQEIAMAPEVLGYSTFLKKTLDEVIHQFKRNSLKIDLAGRTNRGDQYGKVFAERFAPKDIPDRHTITVRTPPQLPRDDLRALQLYLQATEPGREALDDITAMTRFLGVQAPLDAADRKDFDRIRKSPELTNLRKLRFLRQEVRRLRALAEQARGTDSFEDFRLEALAAEKDLDSMAAALRQQGAPTEPRQRTSISPDVLPPELQGFSPDELRAATGSGRQVGP